MTRASDYQYRNISTGGIVTAKRLGHNTPVISGAKVGDWILGDKIVPHEEFKAAHIPFYGNAPT